MGRMQTLESGHWEVWRAGESLYLRVLLTAIKQALLTSQMLAIKRGIGGRGNEALPIILVTRHSRDPSAYHESLKRSLSLFLIIAPYVRLNRPAVPVESGLMFESPIP